MKKSLSVLLTGFVLTASVLFGVETFEGRYDMTLSGDGESVDIAFWVKDGHIRMKMEGKGNETGEMILRDGLSTMLMIMPQQRMYMEMPIPDVAAQAVPSPDDEEGELPFEKTGKTREILGLTAHEFLYDENGEKMAIWATDELGAMPFANNPMLQGWAEAMQRLTGLDSFFPLETIGYENGREAYRMTVTKVEKKQLENALFEAPPGYRKMTMPAGMGGFLPGR